MKKTSDPQGVNTTLVLPDADGLTAAVASVVDVSHVTEHFCPILARHAGETKGAAGIQLMLSLAAYDYTKKQGLPDTAKAAVEMWLPAIATAIIVASAPEKQECPPDGHPGAMPQGDRNGR